MAFKALLLPMVSSGMDLKLSVKVSQVTLEGYISLHINVPELPICIAWSWEYEG
jgi:hypothetical protein